MLSKMNKKNKYFLELLEWLSIPDKLYSINDIKEAIYNKCNLFDTKDKLSTVNLDKHGLILFEINSNPVKIDKIINTRYIMIFTNWLDIILKKYNSTI